MGGGTGGSSPGCLACGSWHGVEAEADDAVSTRLFLVAVIALPVETPTELTVPSVITGVIIGSFSAPFIHTRH